MSEWAAAEFERPARVRLTDAEIAMLAGEFGAATAFALKLIVRLAQVLAAESLVPVTSAHIDGCLYHGQVGVDFVEMLLRLDGRVSIPTTLNVGSLDLMHPEFVRLDQPSQNMARRLMPGYVALGARPTWTCAPYQLALRPAFGEHVAWAESNAIVFANSVLGARTNRYGDFEGPRIFRIGNPLSFYLGREGVNVETASVVYS